MPRRWPPVRARTRAAVRVRARRVDATIRRGRWTQSFFAQVSARERDEHLLERSLVCHDLRRTERCNQFPWRAFRDHSSLIDDRNPVTQRFRFIHVMGREENSAALTAEFCQQLPELTT